MDDASVTCIKLANITYALSSTLRVGGLPEDDQGSFYLYNDYEPRPVNVGDHPRGTAPLAIVAEEGQATLDGGGSVQLIFADSGADVALANLVLRNGFAYEGGAISNGMGTMVLKACVFEYNEAAVRLTKL